MWHDKQILQLLADNRTISVWSDERMTPYLVTHDNKFISYDDEQSLTVKVGGPVTLMRGANATGQTCGLFSVFH